MDDIDFFSTHIHGFWLPHLEKMRQKGFIKYKKSITFTWKELVWKYSGEVTAQKHGGKIRAYGQGLAISNDKGNGNYETIEGTFKFNLPYGICS